MLKERIKYTKLFFDDILPKITQITSQSRYGYHGLSHTIQVAFFALDIAQHIGQEPLPALLAAALHDCARTNDAWCTEHGPMAVPIGKKFLKKHYPNMSEYDISRILYAVKNHTTGRNASDFISACLWDADRIRLSWERGFNPRFFSTDRGIELASMSPTQQQQYIAAQEEFLAQHNIRSRKQIEFDKLQDMIQNGTQFKMRSR